MDSSGMDRYGADAYGADAYGADAYGRKPLDVEDCRGQPCEADGICCSLTGTEVACGDRTGARGD